MEETEKRQIITVKEAARRIGVQPDAVLQLIGRGILEKHELTPPGTHPARRIYGVTVGGVAEWMYHIGMKGRVSNQRYERDPSERARMNAEGWITFSQAARIMGVTPPAIRRHVESGALPMRQEKVRYVPREKVEEIQQQRIAKDVIAMMKGVGQ